jgi:hypothetical protein
MTGQQDCVALGHLFVHAGACLFCGVNRVLECDQCGAKPSTWGPEWSGWSEQHGEGAHCPMDKIQGCDGTMRYTALSPAVGRRTEQDSQTHAPGAGEPDRSSASSRAQPPTGSDPQTEEPPR